MFNKLQYISQGHTATEQLFHIHKALDNGCAWVQLRFKNATVKEISSLAETVKLLCQEYGATFVINDNVELVLTTEADGVHLGLSDMEITKARAILGKDKIIGGTANTFENIKNHAKNGCNYIGLGPFQFTTTKEKLSPILGINGFYSIIKEMKKQQIDIPIYAIGGITVADVESIMETGIYGIAVSGLIFDNPKPSELITQLNEKLYVTI